MIIVIYLLIYNTIYSKKGREVNIVKIVLKFIANIIVVELVYLSIIAITRLEINSLTIPVAIALYIITTIVILIKLENKYSKIKE